MTFTIYEHTPKLINKKGVKSAIEREQQKSLIEKMFKQKVLKVRIDNTLFSKKDYKNIDISSLYNYMLENKDYVVDYYVEIFAGMYLHPSKKSGSYTLMGGKSLKKIYESEQFAQDLIQKFKKILKTLKIF